MYRIRFFSSFCDSINCKSVFERLCETDKMDNYGPNKQIYIVTDESYTHAIIINTTTTTLQIPKENVIGLAFEPPAFLSFDYSFLTYAQKHISKYFIGDSSQTYSSFISTSFTPLFSPFINKYAFMWHITPPAIIPIKNNIMSIMVSQKTQAPGHLYRHKLVEAILESDLDVHIYGRGCKLYSNDSRLKGEFTDNEPYETYKFHICIENFSLPDYTSEKYTNSVLWGTTPIYWGAKNPLFPEYTIQLSGDVIQDMMMVRDICMEPEKYRRNISQEIVRPKLNLLKNLHDIFS